LHRGEALFKRKTTHFYEKLCNQRVYSKIAHLSAVSVDECLSETNAAAIAVHSLLANSTCIANPELLFSELGVLVHEAADSRLAWRFLYSCSEVASISFDIDAISGQVISSSLSGLNIGPYQIYNTEVIHEEPGTLVYDYPNGQPPPTWPPNTYRVMELTQAAMEQHDFILGRDGWDDGWCDTWNPECGVSQTQANAYSTGSSLLRAGRVLVAASGSLPGQCIDTIGHEYGHFISIADLPHENPTPSNWGGYHPSHEPGAISEAVADYFGEMVEAHYLDAQPDWIMGTELSTADACETYRYLYDPTVLSGSDHWNNESANNYSSSGILSKAGWLMGREPEEGYEQFAGIYTQGVGTADAVNLWQQTQKNMLTEHRDPANDDANPTFRDFREDMIYWAFNVFFAGAPRKAGSILAALDSVGIFSNPALESFETLYSPSLNEFTVNGEQRIYMIFKNKLSLRYTYRTCELGGACQWSPVAVVGSVSASSAHASVVFDGYLWIFYRVFGFPPANDIGCKRMSSSGTWEQCPSFSSVPQTDEAPSASVFNGNIYLFYKGVGTGSQPLTYQVYNPSLGTWSGSQLSGSYTITSPVAAGVVVSKLYVVFNSGNGIWYRGTTARMWESYDSATPINAACAGSHVPAALIFRDRLHVAVAKSNSTGHSIHYASYCWSGTCTYRPGEWTALVDQHDSAINYFRMQTVSGMLYFLFGAGEESSTLLSWTRKASE